jgi:hypothetical protein
MDSLILPSKFKVCRWCSLALLDEAMQQDHFAFRVDIEQHPSNSVLTQARTYFVKSIAQRSADRHSNWPTEFHGFNVYSDLLPILDRVERLPPRAHWLPASSSPKENYLYSFQG